MTDQLSKLRVATFRGAKFPYTQRRADHAWQNTEHGIAYRDGQLVDTTGGRNWAYVFTVPFREGVTVQPWANLFTVGLPAFLKLYQEGLEGELIDPIHGSVTVKPASWTENLDVARRDGEDVEIAFIKSPSLIAAEEVTQIPPPAAVEAAASRLDDLVESVDWEQLDPPEPTVDPLSAIYGVGAQIDGEQERVAGKLSGISDRGNAVLNQAERLEDGESRSEVLRDASRLRITARRAADKAATPGRTVSTVIVRSGMSIAALAQLLGMTLEDLLKANPSLATSPRVPPGTEVNRT